MLGCNESNIFSSISANLGNSGEAGRNSQVFGQEMKKRPTGHATVCIWPEKEIYGRHTFVLFVS